MDGIGSQYCGWQNLARRLTRSHYFTVMRGTNRDWWANPLFLTMAHDLLDTGGACPYTSSCVLISRYSDKRNYF